MTTLDDRLAPSAPSAAAGTARLRVVLLLDVLDGRQERFLQAYEQIRHQVAAVPGHISDQLCQSLGNSSQWLITSEWESSEPFMEWVESAEHRAMVEPLHGCVRDTTSLRYVVVRETPEPGTPAAARTARPAAGLDPIPAPPLCTSGVVRHAITFTVKPGSEEPVAKLLADYESPQARVDDTTRLLRTSLFMHGNRVVRAVEVAGDLGNALRHVAAQPEVRAVEEAINPYLEEARDLADPASARAFFARAALPAASHTAPEEAAADGADASEPGGPTTRHAFLYPVRPGAAAEAARLLERLDRAATADPAHPLAAATVFHRGDVLVRMVDVRGPLSAVARPAADDAELRALLIPGGSDDAAGPETLTGLAHGGHLMTPITDRRSH
ncbi:SchA/CurD-like domain-containing protein [Actinacidiphila guanduensis]|uniref:SchA/CurD like domain-containing protein n=1 Tax=Actinacidiphila guanduensis TaxID=310781 RepID=A0A1H0GHB4_9ACTN|nr:SchA/CurD-like domain-containing protein [Actinacidiphila guanduensis]SDO06290.1 SchA/CurD like domain-containing protein [Actinacidiphila guanduensis]